MSLNKQSGNSGEQEVVEKVLCPNCNKGLMLLPQSFPLYDIQCKACNFRVQVKTSASRPKSEIFGAGWDIMDKVLKSGYLVPPIITNNHWLENRVSHHEIRFYPFIPKTNLKPRKLPKHAKRANYKMFNYIGMDKLPYFVLFKN